MYAQVLSRRCSPLAKSLTVEYPKNCFALNRLQSNKSCTSRLAPRYYSVNRLSKFWIPTGGIEPSRDNQDEFHAVLVRAGYVRQAHSGIFHMLPLGHRVQQKLETLIDKHMSSLGASKVALSSISSEDLWRKTNRFFGHGGELFGFKDRKENKYLLAPTHEEEITSIVANTVQSYKDLPLRLYQISRKYRDEARPRQGLLRGREFTMKDLYTFDHTEQEARQTYEHVQVAYKALFDELGLPYLVARADSGNMGGNLSHEYHFVSSKGEDNVISCAGCGNTINDELAMTRAEYDPSESSKLQMELEPWYGISKDRKTLVVAWFPQTSLQQGLPNQVNLNMVKTLVPELDASVEEPLEAWKKANVQEADGTRSEAHVIHLLDGRLRFDDENVQKRLTLHGQELRSATEGGLKTCRVTQLESRVDGKLMQLTSTLPGDSCPECSMGKVVIDKAIEIGHTFYLGTRYSKPLDAVVVGKDDQRVAIQMGCHGIGVSRLIGAIASIMSDSKGLNWPASVAPFHAVVVPGKGNEEDAERLCQTLQDPRSRTAAGAERGVGNIDILLDDRKKAMGWKLNDADLVGYPLIVVLGRAWKKEGKVELQCRRLGMKTEVHKSELESAMNRVLSQL